VAKAAFCGASYPLPPELSDARYNLTRLGSDMERQYTSGLYADVDTLGNFVDNHDWVPRIRHLCTNMELRIRNALAWVMFARGAPIIYYGTEQDLSCGNECRESMWQTGYDEDTILYQFFKAANAIRNEQNISTAPAIVEYADERKMVFRRGDVFVFLNNMVVDGPVTYPVPPPEGLAYGWVEALTGDEAKFKEGGYAALDAKPKVLVRKAHGLSGGAIARTVPLPLLPFLLGMRLLVLQRLG